MLKADVYASLALRELVHVDVFWGVRIDTSRPVAYKLRMQFEWDEAKRDACLKGRGFDFAYATRVFLGPQRIVAQDRRRDYGEDRFQVLGAIEKRVYAVCVCGCLHHARHGHPLDFRSQSQCKRG